MKHNIDPADFNAEIIRMSGMLHAHSIALSRILSILKETQFETERDAIFKLSDDFAKGIQQDLAQSYQSQQPDNEGTD